MISHYPMTDFNPPSPCGEGRSTLDGSRVRVTFQSTLPMRGGTDLLSGAPGAIPISIHPPHAGRDITDVTFTFVGSISIHPPHAGRDRQPDRGGLHQADFNPPSPCGEGPHIRVLSHVQEYFNPPSPCGEGLCGKNLFACAVPFQSTLPMRGGTSYF